MLQSIQKNMSWRAIPIAGFVAGTAFLAMNLVLMPILMDVDAEIILRYMASLVLGSDVLVEESNTTMLIVGIFVHYSLSLLATFIIAIVIHRWGLLIGIGIGSLLGLAIYGINFYALTFLFDFEWFLAINNTVFMLSHVLFGAIAGGIYELFDHYDIPFELEITHETS